MFGTRKMLKEGISLAGIILAGVAAGALSVSQLQAQAQSSSDPATAAAADRCATLAGMAVESGVVEAAEHYAPGGTISGGATAGANVSVGLCRVRLLLRPVPGSEIRVETWLPDNWNSKLMGLGGGGFDGGLSAAGAVPLERAASQGYAAVATDVGHTPNPSLQTWIHGQPERVVDFGHRANHLAAVVAKQVIEAFYGAPARRAYFMGCSNGGREGIMEVSRYPEDYDAVVAGAPALRYLEVVTQLIWYDRTVHGAGGAPELGAKQPLVHAAILRQCDHLDGVRDGVLENPSRCSFDPGQLQCRGADGPDCLSANEVNAFRRIYAGPRLSNGQQVIAGPAPGSEGITGNWDAWVTGPIPAIAGQEFYRWMVYDDPAWQLAQFDLDRDYPEARRRLAPIVNADDPDIGAFIRRGGKLIIYQGWDDPAITARSTIQYFDDVRRRVGRAADRQVRLFMVPGMMHCGGGPGTTRFDMQSELERWDEHGVAPERVIASNPESTENPLTRPLCAWPATARYRGSGSTRDAASFTCSRRR